LSETDPYENVKFDPVSPGAMEEEPDLRRPLVIFESSDRLVLDQRMRETRIKPFCEKIVEEFCLDEDDMMIVVASIP